MVSAAQQIDTDPWRHPEHLADFLDELRRQGYELGPNQYAMSQNVVLALIAHGEEIGRNDILKRYLGPILCSTAREQEYFPVYFDRWIKRRSASGQKEKTSAPAHLLAEAGRRWRVWRWILAGAGAVITILLAYWWQSLGPALPATPVVLAPDPTGQTASDFFAPWKALLPGIGFGLALTLVAWGVWWYFRARLFLSRGAVAEEPDLVSVALDPRLDYALDRRLIAQAAREMKRRYGVQTSELDASRTMSATARHRGEFTPVYRTRNISPEYLVLIERRHLRDEGAQFIDEMISRLMRNQVFIERYYFDHDPRMLYPAGNGQPISLRDLAAACKDHRLLVFSDAATLFDPVTGELARWTEPLWAFHHAALFTPKPVESWGYREDVISKTAQMLPARPSGVLHFAQQINRPQSRRVASDHVSSPFPAELAIRPTYWLSREAPPDDEIETMLTSVRRYLGADGFFWLAACGVYPGVKFNLTLYLGSNLKNELGDPLFTADLLGQMLRLPWFRQGYMPDWLRLELVRRLPKQQNKEARAALNRLWLSAAAGSNKPIELEIARRNRLAMRILAHSVFQKFASQSKPTSPLRDHVFASVMLGRNLEPLAVRIPRAWRSLLDDSAEAHRRGLHETRAQRVVRRISFPAGVMLAAISPAILLFTQPWLILNTDAFLVPMFGQFGLSLTLLLLGLYWLDEKLILFGLMGYLVPTMALIAGLFFTSSFDGMSRDATVFAMEAVYVLGFLFIRYRLSPAKRELPWQSKATRAMFFTVILANLTSSVFPFTPWHGNGDPTIELISFAILLGSVQAWIGARKQSKLLIIHSYTIFALPLCVLLAAALIKAYYETEATPIWTALAALWSLGILALSVWVWRRLRAEASPPRSSEIKERIANVA